MREPSPMTREELLELAALDALGLLSDYESALYTRSFHYAPATVQDQVRDLQALVAADPRLLPPDEPPADLRERVLEHVAAVIERESPGHAPLAIIGRRRALAGAAASSEAAERHRAIAGSDLTRHFWRAATFTLVATVAIIIWQWADTAKQANLISVLTLSENTSAQLEAMLGTTVDQYIFNPAARQVVLVSDDVDATYKATIFFIEGSGEGMLVIKDLPWAEGYELRVRTEANELRTIATFASRNRLGGVAVSIPSQAPGATWEIWFDGDRLMYSV